jgi:hypothetical protein
MNKVHLVPVLVLCSLILAGGLWLVSARSAPESNRALQEVQQQAAGIEQRLQYLEDIYAIENLQRTYGFLFDKALWRKAADLFAADGRLEIGDQGVFTGKDRILAYLQSLGEDGPQYGRLMDQIQLQPVITLAEDGRTAQARWYLLAMGGVTDPAVHSAHAPPGATPGSPYGYLGTGVMENEYIKQSGIWMIKSLHGFTRMYTRDTDGWDKTALPVTLPASKLTPDRAATVKYEQYPGTFIPPVHFAHPVNQD